MARVPRGSGLSTGIDRVQDPAERHGTVGKGREKAEGQRFVGLLNNAVSRMHAGHTELGHGMCWHDVSGRPQAGKEQPAESRDLPFMRGVSL